VLELKPGIRRIKLQEKVKGNDEGHDRRPEADELDGLTALPVHKKQGQHANQRQEDRYRENQF
jgi:hypothetical protein